MLVYLVQNTALTGRKEMRLKDVAQMVWPGESIPFIAYLAERSWMVFVANVVFTVKDLERPKIITITNN